MKYFGFKGYYVILLEFEKQQGGYKNTMVRIIQQARNVWLTKILHKHIQRY